MILMELGLDFLFTDLSQHFGTDLVVFTLKFLIHGYGGIRGDLKSRHLCHKTKSHTTSA